MVLEEMRALPLKPKAAEDCVLPWHSFSIGDLKARPYSDTLPPTWPFLPIVSLPIGQAFKGMSLLRYLNHHNMHWKNHQFHSATDPVSYNSILPAGYVHFSFLGKAAICFCMGIVTILKEYYVRYTHYCKSSAHVMKSANHFMIGFKA